MPYTDAMQLVANVDGYHHVLCFNAGKAPLISIFDGRLQLQQQKEVDIKLKENCDIRVVPFKGYYLLYVHAVGAAVHDLFRVTRTGEVNNLSAPFRLLVERELGKNTSTLQLINQHNELHIVAHAYYGTLKKMGSTVLQVDKDLNPVLARKVLYNFNSEEDILQQTSLAGSSLLVMKLSKSDDTGNSLNVVKVDLATGHAIITSFSSESHLYSEPALSYNAKDSTILVYSMIREPVSSTRSQRTVFIARLNDSLQQTAPIALLKSQFRSNTIANFLLLKGPGPRWLNMSNALRLRKNSGLPPQQNFEREGASAFSLSQKNELSPAYFHMYNQPSGVRFTVLDEQLQMIKDSLVANNKSLNDLQPRPFAQFAMNNKSYLLLVQNFTSSSRGLLMVSIEEGQLLTAGLRVFNKYEYVLPQLQAVENNYVILPYTYKKDIGLVKITIE